MKAAPSDSRSLETDRYTNAPHHYIDKLLRNDERMQSVTTDAPSEGCLPSHTATLIPLRNRDLETLSELFTLDEIEAIEADILCNLTRRLPEPCWEDNPFDFLQDYL
ncbi:hypothetical protein [Egbenema bharatensis]|uniref:hypothetical protein n=1 Tax=Egbenema bharatensis TaxID=3463334 RepID=UPI003A89F2FB